jgi:hypothetical protein
MSATMSVPMNVPIDLILNMNTGYYTKWFFLEKEHKKEYIVEYHIMEEFTVYYKDGGYEILPFSRELKYENPKIKIFRIKDFSLINPKIRNEIRNDKIKDSGIKNKKIKDYISSEKIKQIQKIEKELIISKIKLSKYTKEKQYEQKLKQYIISYNIPS